MVPPSDRKCGRGNSYPAPFAIACMRVDEGEIDRLIDDDDKSELEQDVEKGKTEMMN